MKTPQNPAGDVMRMWLHGEWAMEVRLSMENGCSLTDPPFGHWVQMKAEWSRVERMVASSMSVWVYGKCSLSFPFSSPWRLAKPRAHPLSGPRRRTVEYGNELTSAAVPGGMESSLPGR